MAVLSVELESLLLSFTRKNYSPLGGLSMGGAMSMYFAFKKPFHEVKGVFVLGSFLEEKSAVFEVRLDFQDGFSLTHVGISIVY